MLVNGSESNSPVLFLVAKAFGCTLGKQGLQRVLLLAMQHYIY